MFFQKFSAFIALKVGSPLTFIIACAVVLVWAITGPVFEFSDTWQLIINTGTTIVTFLMVFLIQATQNRDARGLHLKLDEILRAIPKARNELIAAQEDSDEVLDGIEKGLKQEKTHGGATRC